MKIAFYAPFKPLDHPAPSGDRVIGQGLVRFLENCGHLVETASDLRTRWIYRHPDRWIPALQEYRRTRSLVARQKPDLWLTYHTYYKAPDILGPYIARSFGIPYVVFQGIFSTKRRRAIKTFPGYLLNRHALLCAAHVFTNRKEDLRNLRRLLPEECLSYVAPGIYPEEFPFDPKSRAQLRKLWNVGETPVILSAAMFRPDVKTEGVAWTIRSCGRLFRRGMDFYLVIAGDGKERGWLETLAREELPPERVRFAGKIPRESMYQLYSAADMFVFPGIRESLGMVFLESQCCGLPVVAFDNGGIPEVVRQGKTGFLTPPYDANAFDRAVERLLLNPAFCRETGQAARSYVREYHDLNRNYQQVEERLRRIFARKR